jgi:predicted nucleic acid-binding protein
MIILDTNVVSEPLKPAPDQGVVNWLNAQAPETLYITSINLAELMAGVEALPQGKRRDTLSVALSTQVAALFQGRILSFDIKAAQAFGVCHASAHAKGNPIAFADCAMAAIAKANGFMIATRNVRDFVGTGIDIIDPWTLG